MRWNKKSSFVDFFYLSAKVLYEVAGKKTSDLVTEVEEILWQNSSLTRFWREKFLNYVKRIYY